MQEPPSDRELARSAPCDNTCNTHTEIEPHIHRFLVENFLLGDEVGLGSSESLLESGVIDSTGILELVQFLEQTYQITVADEEMLPENLDSIGNIATFVKRKLADGAIEPEVVPDD